ncbi:hypothetical protein BJ878DRAFT_416402 [Calycina marina]|uniref:Cell wall proline rich protein n=1 Tax=Calycina marina TaxID=1763456 RepID=A0A9P7Z6U2_9HELO|nr:hypothetical protein BJ878DRAFT_416402 [Calycina marina]
MESGRSVPTTLPLFSFNPSALSEASTGIASPLLPPISPQTLSPQHRSVPSRSGFHKRGTSEYIGGDGSTGSGLGLMSTSPTKGDNVLPVPQPTSALGTVPGRRGGHAHRRSAAISHSDLSFLQSDPKLMPPGGSAPCSPSMDETHLPSHGMQDSVAKEPEEPAILPRASRVRVGFSDDVQFIPRPLSLRCQSPSVVDERPKTAAARLDSAGPASPTVYGPEPQRRSSNPMLSDIAVMVPETPPTPKSPNKLWSFFGGSDVPHSRPTSATSHKEARALTPVPKSPIVLASDAPAAIAEPESCLTRRSSSTTSRKKQKKVKSWAGSILSRKTRQRGQKQSRRSPTPPGRSYGSMDTSSTNTTEQAPNATATIIEENAAHPDPNTNFSSWIPRYIEAHDDDSIGPMIDLDAALGPFNTPSGRDPVWDAINGTGARKGRRMHSAAGRSGFAGPGMHYHRRAASSPELENPLFGMRHLASSSTMADVFEEDEEDAWEDYKSSINGKTEDDEESGVDIKVVDADNISGHKSLDFTIDSSGLSESERRHVSASMKSAKSNTSLKDETIFEESSTSIQIFDDSIPPRPDSRAQSSDSTVTPPFRARPPKDLAPVDIQPFSLQSPYLTPTSPQSMTHSSMPSPRSPYSYDTQCISTAPSSLADEGGFQSLLLGEPGPELRMSVDMHDVPSLTSSNSTMTRESNFISVAQNAQGAQFREGQRSASFSAAVNRKRSSIVGLSRLISNSHGEKSKLSMETRAPSMDDKRKEKTSKSKRISRLMQFWKPNESS